MNKPATLLLSFKHADTSNSVSRKTLRSMALALKISEQDLVQLALAKLRAQLIPAYPSDDGPISMDEIRQIKAMVDQDNYLPTRSLLEGL